MMLPASLGKQTLNTLLIVAALLVADFSGVKDRFDYAVAETALGWLQIGKEVESAVIVDFDKKSLLDRGGWPPPHEYTREVIGKIRQAKPRAIASEILYFRGDTPKVEWDGLKETIKENRVLMALEVNAIPPGLLPEITSQWSGGEGYASATTSKNGTGLAIGIERAGLGATITSAMRGLKGSAAGEVELVNFWGAGRSVETVTSNQILSGGASDKLRGRYVLLDSSLARNALETPVGPMPPAHLHALALENGERGNALKTSLAFDAAAVVALALCFGHFRRRGETARSLLLAASVGVLWAILIVKTGVFVSPLGLALALLFFPGWMGSRHAAKAKIAE